MRSSAIRHDGPASSRLAYAVGRLYLTLAGWKVEGELPPGGKGVLIAAPHTSGWDLPFMLSVAWVFRLRLNWLGKHTLFRGAAGPFMRWLGGIPVDRRAPLGQVGQAVERFNNHSSMYLAIAPAGTRSQAKHWKSGFYRIAEGAGVPILCGFLDYGRKVGGVGPAIVPSGDVRADMDRLRAFYEGMTGLRADVSTAIVLREELEGMAGDAPSADSRPDEPMATAPSAPAPV